MIPAARQHPGAVLGAVEAALRTRGITRLYGTADALYGVLSVAADVTVWCDGRTLTWRRDGEQATCPAADPDGAAARLAALARTGRPSPERASKGRSPARPEGDAGYRVLQPGLLGRSGSCLD